MPNPDTQWAEPSLDEFRSDIREMLDALRDHWEREDEVLLSMLKDDL